MKRLIIVFTLILTLLMIASCKTIKKEADNQYNLLSSITKSNEFGQIPAYNIQFRSNKILLPESASLKIDDKVFNVNLSNLKLDYDGYECFDIVEVIDESRCPDRNDYPYVSDRADFIREWNMYMDYASKLIARNDSMFIAINKAKTMTMDIKGKTGNGTYIISQEDIAKFKKAYEWAKSF